MDYIEDAPLTGFLFNKDLKDRFKDRAEKIYISNKKISDKIKELKEEKNGLHNRVT